MTQRDGLEAAKKLARRKGKDAAPSIQAHLPEVRTPIKWKVTGSNVASFRPEAFALVVWCYGVPFEQIEGFHDFLATNEIDIAGRCANATGGKASYLGTYLHVDTGAPRYQTFWGLKAGGAAGETSDAEQLLAAALAPNTPDPNLRDLVAVLRSYWVRDGNATDLRYGQARHYINLDTLPIDSCFWGVTQHATTKPIIP